MNAIRNQSEDIKKIMAFVARPSPSGSQINYGFVSGGNLSVAEKLANANLSAELLDQTTMPFVHLVKDGQIVANFQNTVFESIVARLVCDGRNNGPARGNGPHDGLAFVAAQNQTVELSMYSYAAVMIHHCIQQFYYGEQLEDIPFDAEEVQELADLIQARLASLEQDDQLSARRRILALAAHRLD
ncbi:hypothetical protein PILCRDRAFT_92528 [Piloderma croceum F 1598]|uniref:Uncharacterized protein n=1 Tax=Piloderma croceum (strain F 1598) TaxID=765440 RepID=A0A0C3F3R2_PILCF|nr:hypothetical protein PILCRDRAFT_92528 [Piloderma croceum F 1598]